MTQIKPIPMLLSKKKQTKNKKEAQNSDNSQELTSDNCPTKIGSWSNDRFLISGVMT